MVWKNIYLDSYMDRPIYSLLSSSTTSTKISTSMIMELLAGTDGVAECMTSYSDSSSSENLRSRSPRPWTKTPVAARGRRWASWRAATQPSWGAPGVATPGRFPHRGPGSRRAVWGPGRRTPGTWWLPWLGCTSRRPWQRWRWGRRSSWLSAAMGHEARAARAGVRPCYLFALGLLLQQQQEVRFWNSLDKIWNEKKKLLWVSMLFFWNGNGFVHKCLWFYLKKLWKKRMLHLIWPPVLKFFLFCTKE